MPKRSRDGCSVDRFLAITMPSGDTVPGANDDGRGNDESAIDQKKKTHFNEKSLRVAVTLYCEDENAAEAKHGPISEWDVSNVTNMCCMFFHKLEFNGDLSKWDVSRVTSMDWMFGHAEMFNGNLAAWDVSNVTRMHGMFGDATSFNGNSLSAWNVSNVTSMCSMFKGAESFNCDLSSWNTSNVTDMNDLFTGCRAFNGDVSTWNVSSVKTMISTFNGAKMFNCDLSGWDISNVERMCLLYPKKYDGNRVSIYTKGDTMFKDAEAFDGRLSTNFVEKIHSTGHGRPARCLWNMARRLVLPIAKMRCIAYFWLELAAHPRPNGEAPPGAVDAFLAEF